MDINKIFITAITLSSVVCLFALESGRQNYIVETDITYCEMVKIWEENDHVASSSRPGWPPYRGKEVCDEN